MHAWDLDDVFFWTFQHRHCQSATMSKVRLRSTREKSGAEELTPDRLGLAAKCGEARTVLINSRAATKAHVEQC